MLLLISALISLTPAHGCGGNQQVISSHSGFRVTNYENNYDKSWKIEKKDGFSLLVTIEEFKLEYEYSCAYDYLEIATDVTDVTKDEILGRFCGASIFANALFKSCDLTLRFKTDGSTELSGFRICYEFIEDSATTRTSLDSCSGITKYPYVDAIPTFPPRLNNTIEYRYPVGGDYMSSFQCQSVTHLFPTLDEETFYSHPEIGQTSYYSSEHKCWYMHGIEGAYAVEVFVKQFKLEYEDYNCDYDSLEVYAADENGYLGRFCGERIFDTIWSKSCGLIFQFETDGGTQLDGFEIGYKLVPESLADHDVCTDGQGVIAIDDERESRDTGKTSLLLGLLAMGIVGASAVCFCKSLKRQRKRAKVRRNAQERQARDALVAVINQGSNQSERPTQMSLPMATMEETNHEAQFRNGANNNLPTYASAPPLVEHDLPPSYESVVNNSSYQIAHSKQALNSKD